MVLNKKIYALLTLMLIMALSVLNLSNAKQISTTNTHEVQNTSLSILSDIIGLDLTKYEVVLVNDVYDSGNGSIPRPVYPPLEDIPIELLQFNLTAPGSHISAVFQFINNLFWTCRLYETDKPDLSPIYTEPMTSDIVGSAKIILQRYQNNLNATYIQPMIDIIQESYNLKDLNSSTGNIKSIIKSNDAGFVSLSWEYSIQDADSPKGVNLSFKDGVLNGITDGWNLYQFGSEEIAVSKEQAVNMAWTMANEHNNIRFPTDNGTVTMNITLYAQPTVVSLRFAPREPLTLYPFWYVHFRTIQPYGEVDGVDVGIWADNAQVEYNRLTGFYGSIDLQDSSNDQGATPTAAPSSTPIDSPDLSPSIPEFGTWLYLPLVLLSTLVLVILCFKTKRKTL